MAGVEPAISGFEDQRLIHWATKASLLIGIEPMTLRLTAARSNQLSYGSRSAESGIRTHEADARDLKTRPFDRSGIPAERLSIIGY